MYTKGTRTVYKNVFLWSMNFTLLRHVRGCIQKFPDWVDDEIYAYNNKYSLRSNTKGYGGKTFLTDSLNSDTSAPSGSKLYHLQFSLLAASPETFRYSLIFEYL
jgi:hypothetical protein